MQQHSLEIMLHYNGADNTAIHTAWQTLPQPMFHLKTYANKSKGICSSKNPLRPESSLAAETKNSATDTSKLVPPPMSSEQ